MSTELLRNLGEHSAQELIVSLDIVSSETCENCGMVGHVVSNSTLYPMCKKCFVEDIQEWESEGGFSSENIFECFGRVPSETSRAYKVAMSAYWAMLNRWAIGV